MAEAETAPDKSILLTNYERVRDGDVDPKYFIATSLDEASVLRSYGSKTYQTFLQKFMGVPYRRIPGRDRGRVADGQKAVSGYDGKRYKGHIPMRMGGRRIPRTDKAEAV